MVRFPVDGLAEIDVWVHLLERFSRVRGSAACTTYQEGSILGFPGTVPLEIAHDAFEYVMRFNPNNIQMHAKSVGVAGVAAGEACDEKERGAFHVYNELECEAIGMLADLLGGRGQELSGYIASGGTEANIYALWVARNRLLCQCGLTERDSSSIALITPLSSHYSIQKAANLLGLTSTDRDGREVGAIRYLDLTEDYAVDLEDARRTLEELIARGVRGVIASVTCGSTTAGAYDDVRGVGQLLAESGIPFHLHVDAAFGGLVVPFLEGQIHEHRFIQAFYGDKFSLPVFDFRIPQVNSMTVDPHKMGMVPYPAGVVLLRGNDFRYIARRVEYIADETDETLIGSRPAASAAACWAAFTHMGKEGYERVLRKCMKLTDYVIGQLGADEVAGIDVVGRPFTNYFSFRFAEPVLSRLTPDLLKKWDVRTKRFCLVRSLCFRTRQELGALLTLEATIPPEEKDSSPALERYRVYRVAMMPHVSEDTVARFCEGVRAFVEHVLR